MEVVSDPGISGAKRPEDRPGFQQIIELAKEHKFSVLLLWRFDRLARNLLFSVTTVHDLKEQYAIVLRSVTEPIETTVHPNTLLASTPRPPVRHDQSTYAAAARHREALVQGTRIATIARNLRVSRSWASREANAPQTRVMLASMLNNRAETIARLIDHAFDVIEDALQAVKVVRQWPSNRQIEVPDHRIRLEAAGLFLKLFCLPVFRTGQSAIASSMARHPQVAHTSEQRPSTPSGADYKARFEAVRLLIRMLSKV